jgi:hypothetical protein
MPNQQLASMMQYATFSAELCHFVADIELYSTMTLHSPNYFGGIVH